MLFNYFNLHGNETDIPALVTYESQKNISTDSALGIELLSPDGLTENSYLAEDGLTKVSNAKLTLSNAFGNWHCWQEIEGKSLSLMFMKNGAWTSEIALGSTYIDSDGDGYITFADSPSDSILTISASSVDSIYFTQNDNGTYDYSDMYLTIKKANGKNSVIMNNQMFNTLKQWELYLGNREKGYYLLNFSATVQISGTNVTMPYAFILNLTD